MQRDQPVSVVKCIVLVAGLLALLPAAALGSDGRIEINQTCAVRTGCTSGDTPGFPVTLGASGSYVLTSSLRVPETGVDGIQTTLAASMVSIDLGGFEIVREGCDRATPDCTTHLGTGHGIAFAGSGVLRVSDGTIGGMGGAGVNAPNATAAWLARLRLDYNRLGGARLASASVVTGVQAAWNEGPGIDAGTAAVVTESHTSVNDGGGIDARGSVVAACRSFFDDAFGIRSSGGVAAEAHVFTAAVGIDASRGLVVGSRVVGGEEALAVAGDEGVLLRNSVLYSLGQVVELDASSAIAETSIVGFPSIVGGIDLGGNTCNGTGLCP